MKFIRTLVVTIITIALFSSITRADDVVINAVGDIMLAGPWARSLEKRGYPFFFKELQSELAQADINLANLESPLARSGIEYTAKKFRFRGSPAIAPALRAAGFNIVTLANNHSMDFGWPALAETLQHLDNAGIARIGAGKNLREARRAVFFNVRGKRIAFLGYSLTQPIEFFADTKRPGTAPGYTHLITADVAKARTQADFVIVSLHWGREAVFMPLDYQRKTAHQTIEAGADVIIGHHPHVLQGIERYGKGVIFYSLGNFAFASRSATADVSAMIRLRLGNAVREAEIIPLDVLYKRVAFQPRLLRGKEAERVIGKINELSRSFSTEITARNGRYILTF